MPVTVIGSFFEDFTTGLLNNRVDFVGRTGRAQPRRPVMGGVQWLEPNSFDMAADHLGNLGRGAIQGPGFWNYDFALLRTIAIPSAFCPSSEHRTSRVLWTAALLSRASLTL